MKCGNFSVSTVNFGGFRLDGGAMFGSVPKNIWSTQAAPDAENCISLATRCLFVQDNSNGNKILVDVGMGDKWDEKAKRIFAIQNEDAASFPFKEDEITHIVLTHLHFDHAGGISRQVIGDSSRVELVFPQAKVMLQRANFENASAPNRKERASYLKENVEILEKAKVTFAHGEEEVYPGIVVHRVDGHTKGQQWIEVISSDCKIFYPTDLIPTSHHLPVPYHMGYDICAETILREKEEFLSRAEREEAIVVFEHDPLVEAATVGKNAKGHYAIKERISL